MWPAVAALGLLVAVGERLAYRRALRSRRKVGIAGSVIRLALVGVPAAIAGVWTVALWHSAALERGLGLTVALGAAAVVVVACALELRACLAGERGWLLPPEPVD